jgi:hypothetical protein
MILSGMSDSVRITIIYEHYKAIREVFCNFDLSN